MFKPVKFNFYSLCAAWNPSKVFEWCIVIHSYRQSKDKSDYYFEQLIWLYPPAAYIPSQNLKNYRKDILACFHQINVLLSQ